MEVCLVCYEEGKLVGYPGLEQIKALPSFHSVEIKTKPVRHQCGNHSPAISHHASRLAPHASRLTPRTSLAPHASRLAPHVSQGDSICKTIDFMTTPGSVMLVHESGAQVEEDAEFIHTLEEEGKLYNIIRPVRIMSF